MQMKIPKFQLARRGSVPLLDHFLNARVKSIAIRLFLLQSEQLLFDSNLTSCFSVLRLRSAVLSGTALLDILSSMRLFLQRECAFDLRGGAIGCGRPCVRKCSNRGVSHVTALALWWEMAIRRTSPQ